MEEHISKKKKSWRSMSLTGIFIFAFLVLFSFASKTEAATRTWSGGGGAGNTAWATAANWNTVPAAGDAVVFPDVTNKTVTAIPAISLVSISFSGTTGGYSLAANGANTITLTGGAAAISSSATSNTNTINIPITFSTAAPTITTATGGTLTFGSTALINNGGLLLTINTAGTLNLGGIISGAGGLIKSTGTGTLTLSAANTYGASTTTVSAGTLSISSDANLGTAPGAPTPNSIVINGGTLQFTGGAARLTVNANRGIALGSSGGTINVNYAVTGTWGTTETAVVYGGIMADIAGQTGSLTVTGPGMLELAGNSTYSGTTTVNGAYLTNETASTLPYTNTLPTTTVLNIINGGVYDLNTQASTQTIAGLTGDATGKAGSTNGTQLVTLTINNTNNYSFSGIITALSITGKVGADSVFALVKSGTGTQTLGGANTYARGTTVNGGTLLFNGVNTGAGADTVGGATATDTPTLGGTGTLPGAVTVSGTTTAGTIIGTNGSTFTLSGGLALSSGSLSSFNLTGAPGAALIAVTGGTLTASGNTITIPTVTQAGTYHLFSYTSALLSSGFSIAGSGNATGYTYTISYTSGTPNYIDLVATADNTPPTVSSVVAQSLTSINITFSEAMGTGATTSANYTISESGQGTLASHPDTVALVSGNTYVLTWSSGALANAADITVTVANAKDLAGNAIGSPNSGIYIIRAIIDFGTKVKEFIAGIKNHFHFH